MTPSPRPAAVAIILSSGYEHVLLTRRSTAMRHHPGQFCFPGGRLDPGETTTQAAVREACEEVGLTITVTDELPGWPRTVTSTDGSPVTAHLAVHPWPIDAVIASPEELDLVGIASLDQLRRSRRPWSPDENDVLRPTFALPDGQLVVGITGLLLDCLLTSIDHQSQITRKK